MDRVLVVNRNWVPITHVSWQKAFMLVFKDKVEVLAYYDKSVKTPTTRYLIPAVIRLFNYSKTPNTNVVYSRYAVLGRDGDRCQYCNVKLEKGNRTIDHIIPTCRGGKSTFENTVAACKKCNTDKGDRTPHQAGMWLARKPFIPMTRQYSVFFGCAIPEEWKPFLPIKTLKALEYTYDR